MRSYVAVLFSVFLLTGAINFTAFAEENPFEPKMPSKTGCIDSAVKGGPQGSGIEQFCWRDNGDVTVKIVKTKGKMMGMVPVSANTKVITTQERITTIDNAKHTAVWTTNPVVYMVDEYNKLSVREKSNFRKNIEEVGLNMATSMGGTIQRKAGEMHGYAYDLVTVMGTKLWSASDYPLIILRQEMSLMGISGVTEATKIDTNASPPASLFEVGKDLKVTHNREAEEMSESFSRGFVKSMKDPDAAKRMKENIEKSKAEAARNQAAQSQGRGVPSVDAPLTDPPLDEGNDFPEETPTPGNIPPADNDAKKKKQEEMQKQLQKGLDALKGFFK